MSLKRARLILIHSLAGASSEALSERTIGSSTSMRWIQSHDHEQVKLIMTTIADAQAKNIRATLAAISDIVDPPVVVTPPPAPPVVTPPVVQPAPAPVPSHFALAVDDEFSSATLDAKTWWPAYNGVKG